MSSVMARRFDITLLTYATLVLTGLVIATIFVGVIAGFIQQVKAYSDERKEQRKAKAHNRKSHWELDEWGANWE
jgi:uncharacterized membrane protein